nr:methionine adenosyltransferase domain-containing protein [Bacteroidota bacterium]
TFGTGVMPDAEISKILVKNVDMTPRGIIKRLNLLRPIYKNSAAYGHFGRNEFSWEQLDLVATLKKAAK